jgi:hypothetical protein
MKKKRCLPPKKKAGCKFFWLCVVGGRLGAVVLTTWSQARAWGCRPGRLFAPACLARFLWLVPRPIVV